MSAWNPWFIYVNATMYSFDRDRPCAFRADGRRHAPETRSLRGDGMKHPENTIVPAVLFFCLLGFVRWLRKRNEPRKLLVSTGIGLCWAFMILLALIFLLSLMG